MAVPIVVAPSVKVTVPVGVPVPGATTATVAVNVTDWPTTDGDPDELTDVEVAAGATDWPTVPDDPAKETLPLYEAEIVCGPTPRPDVDTDA